jgi:hypothetical protein
MKFCKEIRSIDDWTVIENIWKEVNRTGDRRSEEMEKEIKIPEGNKCRSLVKKSTGLGRK